MVIRALRWPIALATLLACQWKLDDPFPSDAAANLGAGTCAPLRALCASPAECCSRGCRARVAANPVCCLELGQRCSDSTPCCGGLNCLSLGDEPPTCRCAPRGVQCTSNSDCCAGLRCADHNCL